MSSFVAEVPVPLSILSSWSRGVLHEYLQQNDLRVEDAQEIWQSLLQSLSAPTLSEKQTTSTCNCVRIFLKSISTATNPDIRKLPLTHDAWLGCYHAVYDAWPRAKAKPLGQVLEILLETAKKGMSEDDLSSVWRIVSLELSATILRGQPIRRLKGALALSAFFLEKGWSYEIYCDSVGRNIAQGDGEGKSASNILQYLINGVLVASRQHDAQSSAEKCFKVLLKAQRSPDIHSWWLLVRDFVADHVDSLDTIAASIFPVLLDYGDTVHQDVMLRDCGSEGKAGLVLSLALLQSLREREMISQYDLIEIMQRTFMDSTSSAPDVTNLLLSHSDDGVRIRVLRLLVSSKMTNAPFSLPILQQLQHYIYLWFRPGGSHERGETLSIIRKLISRLRGGSATLQKAAAPTHSDLELLDAHKNCVATLVTNVHSDLRSNASYGRHIMALSILRCLFESRLDGCDRNPIHRDGEKRSNDPEWPFSLCLRQTSTAQDLLALASNAYEDVRALSVSILNHMLASKPNAHSQLFSKQLQAGLRILIPQLEQEAAQTNRSDQADGLGRLISLHASIQRFASNIGRSVKDNIVTLELLDRLEQLLADKAVFDEPDSQPLHGLLLGVMYCMDSKEIDFETRKRVIFICRQIWRAVTDRLCVDSPEVEATEDLDVLEEAGTGPKDMLSYSWRALRDSSLLLRSQLNFRGLTPSNALEALNDIGRLCMEQLTRLRHRGAFSTVAQTFTLCCERCVEMQGPALVGLRCTWYEEAEIQIQQQADRLTRRSAGLPAMLASILSPDDPKSFASFVDSFIVKSHVTAPDQANRLSLAQVHAMNTLREVMVNSRFRNAIVPHVQKILTLATENLGSNIWAIQNCGLMLYRAGISRVAHGDDSQSLDSYAGEPESLSSTVILALDLLRTRKDSVAAAIGVNGQKDDCDNALSDVEQKFAALDMISHFHPTNELKDAVFVQLFELLSSPVWLVRERAAEVIASLVPFEKLQKNLNECLVAIKPNMSQNKLHGILLYGRKLLHVWLADASKLKLPSDQLDHVMEELFLVVSEIGIRRLAPPVWATLLEMANDMCKHVLQMGIRSTLPSLNHEKLLEKVDIRGYYLPETALLYNVALELIASHKEDVPRDVSFDIPFDRMLKDPNAARSILERLLGDAFVFQIEELLQLCRDVLPRTHPDAARLLIDMVSLSVERYPSDWNPVRAQQVLDIITQTSPTREVRSSNLVARARLIPLLAQEDGDIAKPSPASSPDRPLFEADVSDAARDEMDTSLRLQAAKALSIYLPTLKWDGDFSIGLLFTLRDLLNDDDEDVRTLASCIASTFLIGNTICLQLGFIADGICAPAVTIQLERLLHSRVCEVAIQPEFMIRKLLAVSPDIDLESHLRKFLMREHLNSIKAESQALFSVERQNLYIDEVQEIQFWSSLCSRLTKHDAQLGENIKNALQAWIVDGLSTVSSILHEIEDDHPMLPNLTHDLDTLLLCIRVVSVAGIYLGVLSDGVQGHNPDLRRQSIEDQLLEIKVLASQRHCSPDLSRAIDRI